MNEKLLPRRGVAVVAILLFVAFFALTGLGRVRATGGLLGAFLG